MTCRELLGSVGWLAVYVAAFVLGRQTVAESGLAYFWPAAGVAALWLLRSWGALLPVDVLLLFTATVLTSQAVDLGLLPAICFGVANVSVGLVVRASMHRATAGRVAEPGLPRVFATRELVALGAGAALAGLVSAVPGTLAGLLISGIWTPEVLAAWMVRNTAGCFVVACAVLVVVGAVRSGARGVPALTQRPRRRGRVELVAALALSVSVTGLVFWTGYAHPLTFLPLTISAFVGYRFAPAVAALQTFVVSVAAVTGTLMESGPFGAMADPVLAAVATQAFVVANTLIAVVLSFDVAERLSATRRVEELQAEAAERAQVLETVTQSLRHGLTVIEADGTVLVENEAARRLAGDAGFTGWRRDGEQVEAADLPHVRALAGDPAREADFSVDGDHGARVVHAHAEPLQLTGPRARTVAVVTMQDVTQERGQVAELVSFAGVVAHDLRNPLMAVTSWTELLADHLESTGHGDEVSGEMLDRIAKAGHSMGALISDLLDYASASSAPLRREVVDAQALVSNIAAELRAASPSAPIIEARDLGLVDADPLLLRQVFANLLGNAVKYVAPGVRPHVRVRGRLVAGGLEVSVTDNGIGIPAEARGTVFEGFTRAHAGDTSYAGTGLGLAICARAVERHGGTIAVGAGPHGRGTTFTLTLPLPARDALGEPVVPVVPVTLATA